MVDLHVGRFIGCFEGWLVGNRDGRVVGWFVGTREG